MTDPQGRADALANRLRRLAEVAQDTVTHDLRGALAAAQPALLAAWVREFGGVEALPTDPLAASAFLDLLYRTLVDALDPARVDPATVAGAWRLAYGMGLEHAALTAWWTPETKAGTRRAPIPPLAAIVADVRDHVLTGLDGSVLSSRGFVVVQEALARSRQAVHRVNAATAYEVTSAATTAVRDVAAEQSATVVWVAERDGCLHCLAYAGETSAHGGVFPTGLTFADRPLKPHGALIGPPLHPHCRCSLQILHPSDTAVVDSLKREAKRSVLRGESVDGEPEKLRAAERLLVRGAGLPKTVEERAARAVARGKFERRDRG